MTSNSYGLCTVNDSRPGLEPILTTSELAEYLGVQEQAIYGPRTGGRGFPAGALDAVLDLFFSLRG